VQQGALNSGGYVAAPGAHSEYLPGLGAEIRTPYGAGAWTSGGSSVSHEFSSCCNFWHLPIGTVNAWPGGGFAFGTPTPAGALFSTGWEPNPGTVSFTYQTYDEVGGTNLNNSAQCSALPTNSAKR
jgi:hypothetical protein